MSAWLSAAGWATLGVACAALLLRGAQLALLLRIGRALRARSEPYAVLDGADVPSHVRAVLDRMERLEALGFAHVGWVRGGLEIAVPPHAPVLHRLLQLPGTGTFAWLRIADPPRPGGEVAVTLVGALEGGGSADTSDPPGSVLWLQLPAWIHTTLCPGADPAALLDAHRRSVASSGALEPPCTLAEHLAATAERDARLLAHAEAVGDLAHDADGSFALTWPAALRLAWRSAAASFSARRAADARRRTAGEDAAPWPVEVEVEAWARADALRASPAPSGLTGAVLVGTFTLFALSLFGLVPGVQVAAVLAVVGVHELGHYLAMRGRGYHDARIFFVPFLGGATTGHKDGSSLADEMWVLLAGPLPGLVCGLLVIAAGAWARLPPWAGETATIAVAINGLNLLPLFPLDGGRIVHRLVARGRPRTELAFRLLGVAGLVALGVALEAPLLWIVPALMLLGARSQWALAAAERALRQAPLPVDVPARRARILGQLRASMPKDGLAVRLLRARLLEGRLDGATASLGSRAAWMALYLGSIAGPAALLLWGHARAPAVVDPSLVRIVCGDASSLPPVGVGPAVLWVSPEWASGPPASYAMPTAEALRAGCVDMPWSDTSGEERARDGSPGCTHGIVLAEDGWFAVSTPHPALELVRLTAHACARGARAVWVDPASLPGLPAPPPSPR